MKEVIESKSVLMIEDDHGVRAILVIFLEKAGFRVLEAADGAEAKAVWHDQFGMIDVVVSDVLLPDALGTQLVEEFRQERPEVKVILMSGGAPAPAAHLLKWKTRADEFLSKPFTPRTLVDAIGGTLAD